MATNKKIVSIRLKPKTIEKIKEIAETKDIRYTELIRKIVESYAQMWTIRKSCVLRIMYYKCN